MAESKGANPLSRQLIKATLRLFRCFADTQQELFRLLAAEDEFQWLFANSLHFKSQGQGQRRRLDKYRVTDRRTH
jgi:hypothetical protein